MIYKKTLGLSEVIICLIFNLELRVQGLIKLSKLSTSSAKINIVLWFLGRIPPSLTWLRRVLKRSPLVLLLHTHQQSQVRFFGLVNFFFKKNSKGFNPSTSLKFWSSTRVPGPGLARVPPGPCRARVNLGRARAGYGVGPAHLTPLDKMLSRGCLYHTGIRLEWWILLAQWVVLVWNTSCSFMKVRQTYSCSTSVLFEFRLLHLCLRRLSLGRL